MVNQALNAPSLEDLQLLTVLAQTRSFTQTAARLSVSKASVSLRVTELERRMGLPLVSRTTRSVRLTDAGARLVDEITPSLHLIEQSWTAVRDQAGAPRGLVRVTAPVAFGRQRLAPLIPAFLAAYPEVRVELDLSDRMVRLAHEGFDLAVRHTQSPPDNHVAWALCPTRSWLVASPAYLADKSLPQHPAELADHQCLPYLRDSGPQTWAFEKDRAGSRAAAQRVTVAVGGSFRANNSEVLRAAVLGGAGIGLLPDFSVDQAVAQGDLTVVLPAWRPVGFFGDHIYAIRPFAPRVPRAVQVLVDHLRSGLAPARRLKPAAHRP